MTRQDRYNTVDPVTCALIEEHVALAAASIAGTGVRLAPDVHLFSNRADAVPVTVRLSGSVVVCVSGKGTWFWTHASFSWPAGLRVAFAGGNAQANQFD